MQVTRILIHLNQNRTLKLNLGQWLRPWASWKFYEWDYILRLTIVVLDCDSLQNLPLVFCLTSSVWGVKDKSCHKLCPHLFQLQRLFLFPYQNIWTLSFQAFACSGEVQVFVRPHATSYHASHKHFIKVKKKKNNKKHHRSPGILLVPVQIQGFQRTFNPWIVIFFLRIHWCFTWHRNWSS